MPRLPTLHHWLFTLAGGLLMTACAPAAGPTAGPVAGAGAQTGLPPGCRGAPALQVADPATVVAAVRARGLQVLSFYGYSGAGYDDPPAMLALAGRLLDAEDPARVLVNLGGTAEGIGAVYALAKARGFTTLGIVSTLARDEGVALSPCADQVFLVPDATWGGRLPGAADGGDPLSALSPVSQAMVLASDRLVAIGGGEVARDELLAARALGKPVQFHPADLHRASAIDKARRQGRPAPTDFRGAAHAALRADRESAGRPAPHRPPCHHAHPTRSPPGASTT